MTVSGLSALNCLTGSRLSSDPFDQHFPRYEDGQFGEPLALMDVGGVLG